MTDIPYREHFEQLLEALKKLQEERWIGHRKEHEMGQIAFDGAFKVLDARLEQMNQFRTQILEERRDFVRSETYATEHRGVETRLADLEKYRSNMDGRMWMLGAVLIALNIGLNLLFKFWGR